MRSARMRRSTGCRAGAKLCGAGAEPAGWERARARARARQGPLARWPRGARGPRLAGRARQPAARRRVRPPPRASERLVGLPCRARCRAVSAWPKGMHPSTCSVGHLPQGRDTGLWGIWVGQGKHRTRAYVRQCGAQLLHTDATSAWPSLRCSSARVLQARTGLRAVLRVHLRGAPVHAHPHGQSALARAPRRQARRAAGGAPSRAGGAGLGGIGARRRAAGRPRALGRADAQPLGAGGGAPPRMAAPDLAARHRMCTWLFPLIPCSFQLHLHNEMQGMQRVQSAACKAGRQSLACARCPHMLDTEWAKPGTLQSTD